MVIFQSATPDCCCCQHCFCWSQCSTSNRRSTNSAGLISIRLEQKNGDDSRTVPQNTVFHNGNILRFRLTSRIAGYLYVVDKGTTGQTTTLFPVSSGTGSQNRIEPDQTMVVPAMGDGWFEVNGSLGIRYDLSS
jgi:hypothetical protein